VSEQEAHPSSATPTLSLPQLNEATVKRLRRHPPDFEDVYRRLQQADPTAARWLLEATERLAPADPTEKEKYASLMLLFYHMLEEELLLKRFGWLISSSLDVSSEPVADLVHSAALRLRKKC
jgi:hypothetical protein